MWETWFNPWVGKIPWRRRLATLVFWHGEFPVSMQSQRVRHDWMTFTHKHLYAHISSILLIAFLACVLKKSAPGIGKPFVTQCEYYLVSFTVSWVLYPLFSWIHFYFSSHIFKYALYNKWMRDRISGLLARISGSVFSARSTFRKLRSWHLLPSLHGKKWGNSDWLYFGGLQNHCRWWLQPWN